MNACDTHLIAVAGVGAALGWGFGCLWAMFMGRVFR